MFRKKISLCSLLFALALFFILPGAWAQTISTVAGNGTSILAGNGPSAYLAGDGGSAPNAFISLPTGVAVDKYGNIFIADFHANSVRKVNASTGIISTVAGNGNAGSVAGGGLATNTPLNGPADVAVDASGNLFILDIGNNCIWKVNAEDGIIQKIETFESNFSTEGDITIDAAGNVYYAKANRVRKVNPNNRPTVIAGNGTAGYSGDGGLATNALVKDVRGVAVDASGNIYISGDNRIRKINASDGVIYTIAGNGTAGYNGDGGLAINALLTSGTIALDTNNNIYLTDGTNNRIRKINTSNGIISTIAGNGPGGFISSNGITGFKGDGGLATEAWLNIPNNIAIDLNQNIYISDGYNYRVRKINMSSGPIITKQPVDATVQTNQDAHFSIIASGVNLTYQWQEKRTAGVFVNISDSDLYRGATSATLTLNQVPESMNGYQYRVVVSNGISETSSTISLTVSAPVSVDTGMWQVVGSSGFSDGSSNFTSIAFDASGTPYVCYMDNPNDGKVTVKKFTGNKWENVGAAGFSMGQAWNPQIVIDANGTPYVGYRDDANGYRATVKKFNGNSWVTIGTTGFSAGSTSFNRIALGANNTPFVAYSDGANGNKVTVKMFNGSSWINVGSGIVSTRNGTYIDLAFDSNGIPYVAYRDVDDKLTVKKLEGNSWINVGDNSVSAGGASQISLAIDIHNVAYVCYKDDWNGNKVIVKKFNGNSWINVGTAGFPIAQAEKPSLILDSNETPYVVFQDRANDGKATVKKFDGSNWINVGPAGFTVSTAGHNGIAVNNKGIPFIVYGDGANGYKATVMKFASAPLNAPTVTAAANCGPGTVTLTASGAANGNYRWYTTATGGSAVPSATNATFTMPSLAATTTYYVSIVAGNRESERIAVTATINPIPAAPTGTASLSFCQGSTVTALSAAGDNLKWYTSANGEQAMATAPTPNTTRVGTTEYYVSQIVNGCESNRTRITVTITPAPSVSLAAFTDVCNNITTFTLTGGQPVGGVYAGVGIKNGVFAPGEAGVGTHPITYSYTDAHGCTATAVQHITVVACADTKEVGAISNLLLSPNPTTEKVRVKSTVQEKTDVLVRILSLDGKMVLEKAFPNVEGEFDKVIDLKGIGRGIYLLQNITDKGMVKKRLVIE